MVGWRFKLSSSFAATAVALSAVALFDPSPASATTFLPGCTPNSPWDSDYDMTTSCSPGDMVGTGYGVVADRESSDPVNGLLKPDRVALYKSQGFDEDFLWFAPLFTFVMPTSGGPSWSACCLLYTSPSPRDA